MRISLSSPLELKITMTIENYTFPSSEWHYGYSDSYGADDLYHGRTVVEKIFSLDEQESAEATFEYLQNISLNTVQIHFIEHEPDKSKHIYVFMEKQQFLSIKAKYFPELVITDSKPKRKRSWLTFWK